MENPTPPPVPRKDPPVQSSENTIDVIALIAVAFWLLSAVGMFIVQKLVPNWYEPPIKYVQIFSNLVIALIPIVLALAIKNKDLKLIALIAGGLLTAFLFFTNLSWALNLGI